MKERIYPSWDDIELFHTPLTDGEERLARFLDKKLPEDWTIFVEPYLNGSRPDIVVLNPQVGVVIYEVKDWDLSSYTWKRGQLFVKDAKGSYPVKDPARQVNYYKSKIVSQLVPSLGEEVKRNKSAFGLVKTGIYFHKMSGKDARKFNHNRTDLAIIGHDDLCDSKLSEIVPGFDIDNRKYMKAKWVDEILFWLKPPFHSLEQVQNLELTDKQKEHAEPQQGHHRLRGVTGSGKTLVLAYRAAKLASQDLRVLIITYNVTLGHLIRDMIARSPFAFSWEKICFNHFHGFCNDVLNELEAPVPHEDYFRNIVPAVKEALEKETKRNEVEDLKFDAILIDEGQDYKWEWYDCLCGFLRERDELLLVCDEKQNIYERELNWINGKMNRVKFRGPWKEMNEVFRLPKVIGDETNRFSLKFGLDQSVKVKEYTQLMLGDRPIRPHLVWKNIQSEQWLSEVENAYRKIKTAQLETHEGHPTDIVILLPTKDIGMKTASYFTKNLQIEVNHVFENEAESKYHRRKKAFWMGDSRLKMSTIHSFKGWEAVHVVLLIPENWNGMANLDSIVYTAMTRTRENLIVLNCNERYIEYGKTLPNKWQ